MIYQNLMSYLRNLCTFISLSAFPNSILSTNLRDIIVIPKSNLNLFCSFMTIYLNTTNVFKVS